MIATVNAVRSVTTILFDIFLALGFPSLCFISWPNYVPFTVFVMLIVIHISIAVVRYCYLREIVWPLGADIVAIYMGATLLISALVPRQALVLSIMLATAGLVLMYGHVRKIMCPKRPYYFGG